MHDSIWKQTIKSPSFPTLRQDLKTDVLIIGGGIAGILCAWQLEQAGVEYALIEAGTLCGGVTQNTTAKVTSQHGLCYHKLLQQFGPETARQYYDANEAAKRQLQMLAQEVNCDFQVRDHFVYATDTAAQLEAEAKALERLEIPYAYCDQVPLPVGAVGAIRFKDQGQFHPLKCLYSIAPKLRIYTHTPAREITDNTVRTDFGRITAKKIIVATHFPLLNKKGMFFLKLYQERAYVLALENGPDLGGMYLDGGQKGLSFRNYDGYLLLGGGSHRTGKPGGGWTELEKFSAEHYSGAKIAYRWATQDCMTLDGVPYVGAYSKNTPNLYVATGFHKWGMTSAMSAAMVLKDLVLGKHNPYAAVVSPSRRMLRPQLLSNGVEAVCSLVKPTKPRCPHMGCALQWNAQERTWDCPCHGSRFSREGRVLDRPAVKGIQFRKKT